MRLGIGLSCDKRDVKAPTYNAFFVSCKFYIFCFSCVRCMNGVIKLKLGENIKANYLK